MIRLTKLSDYGLIVLTHFANHSEKRVWNARDVAEQVHLPLPTVSKLLKAFARGGLLKAHRGVHGGYSLVKDPQTVRLPEIVEVLEGPVAITECQEGGETSCILQLLCPLRPTWSDLNKAVRETLEKVTLADLAKGAAQHETRLAELAKTAPPTMTSERPRPGRSAPAKRKPRPVDTPSTLPKK